LTNNGMMIPKLTDGSKFPSSFLEVEELGSFGMLLTIHEVQDIVMSLQKSNFRLHRILQ